MRYAASPTGAGTRSSSTGSASRVTGSPARRAASTIAPRSVRSGCGAVCGPVVSLRNTPNSRRMSVSASRADAAMATNSAAAGAGTSVSRYGAVSACTAISDMWWATTSCISRAIRVRSSSTARRSCSRSLSSVCAASACRDSRLRRIRSPTIASAPSSSRTGTRLSGCDQGEHRHRADRHHPDQHRPVDPCDDHRQHRDRPERQRRGPRPGLVGRRVERADQQGQHRQPPGQQRTPGQRQQRRHGHRREQQRDRRRQAPLALHRQRDQEEAERGEQPDRGGVPGQPGPAGQQRPFGPGVRAEHCLPQGPQGHGDRMPVHHPEATGRRRHGRATRG